MYVNIFSIKLVSILVGVIVFLIGSLLIGKSKPQKVTLDTSTNTESARIFEMIRDGEISDTKYGHFYKKYVKPYVRQNPDLVEKIQTSLKINEAELRQELVSANMLKKMSVEEYVSLQIMGLAGLVLFFLVGAISSRMEFLFIAVAAYGICSFLPKTIIKQKIADKKLSIETDLPDFLELVKTATEAGLNINEAINKVAMRIDSPLANEFKNVMAESKSTGGDWRASIENMLKRNNIDVLTDIMSDVLIATEKGTPIADTLAKDINLIRSVKVNAIQENAKKRTTYMMLVMMIFMVIPLMAILLIPAAFTISGGF